MLPHAPNRNQIPKNPIDGIIDSIIDSIHRFATPGRFSLP